MSHLEYISIHTAPEPSYSIIWLHGLGADGHDFEPLVPQLVAADWPGIHFLFPHAPMRPITVNQGATMRAWYDIAGFDIVSRQDEDGIRQSIAQVETLIAAENARGIPAKRIFLAGFSQGGAIALACGLRHPQALAGIIALSTYLPLADKTRTECQAANFTTPIFQAHGEHDPIVALSHAQQSHRWLQDSGYKVRWHTYAMAHQVCAAEISDLRDWLAAILKPR